MVNDLRVNYNETITVGNNVTIKGGDFQELLKKVETANNELKTYWEGTDASKYSTAVEQQAQVMKELEETIKDIGEFLVKTGTAYKEVMETNASGIKG